MEQAQFERGWQEGINQLLHLRQPADLDTPVSAALKLGFESPGNFLLESVTGGETRGRYSIIGIAPDLIWECYDNRARINRRAAADHAAFEWQEASPLSALRELIEESRIDLPDGLPAASAGLFGYLGYDMVRLVERLPIANPDPIGMPDARLLRPSLVAVFDGVLGDIILVAPAWHQLGVAAKDAYFAARRRLLDARQALLKPPPPVSQAQPEGYQDGLLLDQPRSNFTREAYLNAVQRARQYIGDGDIFQVVPSQRWSQAFPYPSFALYRALRRKNPSPFMFHFDFGDSRIVGASPEILVRVFGNTVTIRPIAGTRPRGRNEAEDRALEAELLADEKECAEHLMLLDLGRNDVGRVARVGTVKPTEQFIIERYSHVMHIVSNVEGRLAEGQDALSALLAGLPAGTVSGAPKVRAMEIIDELEPEKRGVYGGAVGYFSAGGDMDMCIALRTAVIKDGVLYVQAGGGVVFDSTPELEFEETVHKANALQEAAADARRFTPGVNFGT